MVAYSTQLTRPASRRRRGYVSVLVAGSWMLLASLGALSFDLSRMYSRKAEAQKAADAAALAGAGAYNGIFDPAGSVVSDAQRRAIAESKVREYAAANGYDVAKGATVQGAPGTGAEEGLYRVTLWRPEPVYFARIFFGPTMNVYGTAAAEATRPQDVPLQNYGASDGPISLAVFGPDSFKFNGDPFSVRYVAAGNPTATTNAKENIDYKPGGYDFNVTPVNGVMDFVAKHRNPDDGTAMMEIEIFDPGTDNGTRGNSAQRGVAVDEIRPGWTGTVKTSTQYTLRYGSEIVGSKVFGPGNQGPDMAWDKTFQVNLADPRFQTGQPFILNVTATAGTSENGFNLRAGPTHPAGISDADWAATYGNQVSMSGKGSLPLNFNADGLVTIDLGYVPPLKSGGKVYIEKFDVDVLAAGSTNNTVTYYDNGAPRDPKGIIEQGKANGVWAPADKYDLPVNYGGGKWTAQYSAGSNDTSVWRMRYTGPGNFRLVR